MHHRTAEAEKLASELTRPGRIDKAKEAMPEAERFRELLGVWNLIAVAAGVASALK